MGVGTWYAALFAISTGAVVAVFWVVAIATGGVQRLLAGRTDGPAHVAAEFVTAALLIAGGAATIVSPNEHASAVLYGMGLGALAYALIEAPLHYRRTGLPLIAWAAWLAWPFAVAAAVARFAR